MNRILIFAGTTEGRELSEFLSEAEISHTVSVISEYGTEVMKESEYLCIHREKMDAVRMRDFILENGFDLIIDATHPYAIEVSRNIKEAVKNGEAEYIRIKREEDLMMSESGVCFYATHEECAARLSKDFGDSPGKTNGNILLTIGCRELSKYCIDESIKEKLIVRIIPDETSLSYCHELGIKGKNIIAMQGPYSVSMNEAMIDMYDIAAVVSKQSGAVGGFREKVSAAKNKGIPLYVIGRAEEEEEALSVEEAKKYISDKLHIEIQRIEIKKEAGTESSQEAGIVLCGIGMGGKGCLTEEVLLAVKDADVLIGAKRMLEAFPESTVRKVPSYKTEEILGFIKDHPEYRNAVVLFSGDSGFYSGAAKLKAALSEETAKKTMNASVTILPGISSVSYLASKCNLNYEDALILSMHGKELMNAANRVKENAKIFLLLSGAEDVRNLGRKICDAGLKDVRITIGMNLSYEDEQIVMITPEECEEFQAEGILTAYIENRSPEGRILTPGLKNEDFIREKVPMTKEEVREVSLSKLHLTKDSILYDIGSGTGSISVEAAGMSDDIRVFAIEYKEEAAMLTEKNAEKFHLENICVIRTKAPEGLDDLPPATHAFIGGSGGNLKEIMDTLYRINPEMRVVINAISLETLSEIKEILKLPYVLNTDVVLAQFSHAKNVMDYNLMTSDNPVWICSFDFKPIGY